MFFLHKNIAIYGPRISMTNHSLNFVQQAHPCFGQTFCYGNSTTFEHLLVVEVVYIEGDLSSYFCLFSALFWLSFGIHSITITQQKLESGSNGSYCVAMYSVENRNGGFWRKPPLFDHFCRTPMQWMKISDFPIY